MDPYEVHGIARLASELGPRVPKKGGFVSFVILKKSEVIFGKGRRTATFQFSESGGSLNGPDLFTELPFL